MQRIYRAFGGVLLLLSATAMGAARDHYLDRQDRTRAVSAGWSAVTPNFGGVPMPFTINSTMFNFYASADCTGAKLNSSVNYTVSGAGHIFNNGDSVRYDGASAWEQALDSGVGDPTTIGSMQFMFCGGIGYCSENGGFKCFTETCAAGVCTTSTPLAATTVG